MTKNNKIIHFIEIGPLMEQNFRGIPKVICEIAKYFVKKENSIFFLGDVVIPKKIVEKIVLLKNPTYLHVALSNLSTLDSLNQKL